MINPRGLLASSDIASLIQRGKLTPGQQVSYAQAADVAMRPMTDPYAYAAERERMVGVRYPRPYDAAAYAAANPYDSDRDFVNVGSDHAIYDSHTLRGWRGTLQGGYGELDIYGRNPMADHMDARTRQSVGWDSRTPGFMPEWDFAESQHRYSGLMNATGAFSQRIVRERPILQLRGFGGDALVQVDVGMQGGAVALRRFQIGGPFTATFSLGDWDTCRVRVVAIDVGAEVQYAWVGTSTNVGNMELFLVQRVVGAVNAAVPLGAYAVILEAVDASWDWITTQPDDPVAPVVIVVNMPVAARQDVQGTVYQPSVDNNVVWVLRAI